MAWLDGLGYPPGTSQFHLPPRADQLGKLHPAGRLPHTAQDGSVFVLVRGREEFTGGRVGWRPGYGKGTAAEVPRDQNAPPLEREPLALGVDGDDPSPPRVR